MPERVPRNPDFLAHLLPGHIEIGIPDLRGWSVWKDGKETFNTNLTDAKLLQQIGEKLRDGRLKEFVKNVREGKSKAVFVPLMGGIAIFVAAIGIELGVRHGRDIRELLELVDKQRKRGKGAT